MVFLRGGGGQLATVAPSTPFVVPLGFVVTCQLEYAHHQITIPLLSHGRSQVQCESNSVCIRAEFNLSTYLMRNVEHCGV